MPPCGGRWRRPPEKAAAASADIILVGASKMNDAAACQEAIAAGIDALGENRVQEMTAKLAQNAYDGAPLHFIGHLQRNKVRAGGGQGRSDPIRRLSWPCCGRWRRRLPSSSMVQDILLEVNIGGEEAKSGFAPEEMEAAPPSWPVSLPHVRVRGLMTIPPVETVPHGNLRIFRENARALYVDINGKIYDNELEYISMGMSGDFADAIRAGSNHGPGGDCYFRCQGLYQIKITGGSLP